MARCFLLICILLLQLQICFGQSNLYAISNGNITFFSKAPLEDISAVNPNVMSLINPQSNEIVVRVPISKFEFPNKLMQEHFNENYLESAKYPVATFKGKINENLNWDKPGIYTVSATGILNIHGKDTQRTLKGIINIGEKNFKLDTQFKVRLEDHLIEIPKLVFNKIAEEIEVSCQFTYKPYKRN
jgi:hypothetical protein